MCKGNENILFFKGKEISLAGRLRRTPSAPRTLRTPIGGWIVAGLQCCGEEIIEIVMEKFSGFGKLS